MTKKRKLSLLFLSGILAGLVLFVCGFGGWGEFKKSLISKAGQTAISLSSNKDFLNNILGFEESKYYMLVLLDNQKLTSFGGSPTIYSIVKVEKGILSISELSLLNTEDQKFIYSEMDGSNIESISNIFFELYKNKSRNEQDLNAVVGFTYSSIEDILELIGGVKFINKEVSYKNTEELIEEIINSESNLGITQNQKVLDLVESILKEAKENFFNSRREYVRTLKKIFVQEKAFIYHFDSDIRDKFILEGLIKNLENYKNDSISLIENELSDSKINKFVKRKLDYKIFEKSKDVFVGNLSLEYEYEDGNSSLNSYTSNIELSAVVSGQLVYKNFELVLYPGEKEKFNFEFDISDSIDTSVKTGKYSILINKQVGASDLDFSIDFDVEKDLELCIPFESISKSSKTSCNLKTKIKSDSEFSFVYNQ